MSITVTCPKCKTKAEAPDSAAGAKGKCRACGATVLVRGVAKICCGCGIDVVGQKRTKDQHGNYYCEPCWSAKITPEQCAAQVAAYRCPACGKSFSADQVYDDGGQHICVSCHAEANSMNDRFTALVAEAESELASQRTPPVSAISNEGLPLTACVLCGGRFIYAYLRNINGKAVCIECDDARRAHSSGAVSRSAHARRANTSAIIAANAWKVLVGVGVAGPVVLLWTNSNIPRRASDDDRPFASNARSSNEVKQQANDKGRADEEARAAEQRQEEEHRRAEAQEAIRKADEQRQQDAANAAEAARQQNEQQRKAKAQQVADGAAETRLVQLVNQGIKDLKFPQHMFELAIELVKARKNSVDAFLAVADRASAQSEVEGMKASTREAEEYRNQMISVYDTFRQTVFADPALVAAVRRLSGRPGLAAEQENFLKTAMGSDGEPKAQDGMAANNVAARPSDPQPRSGSPANAEDIAKSLLGYIAAGQVFVEHHRHHDEFEQQGDRYLAAGDGSSAEASLNAALKENEACGQALEIEKARLDELKQFQIRDVYGVRDTLLNAPGLDADVKAQLREFQLKEH